MENFFGILKAEPLYIQDLDSLEHFKAELIDYLVYHSNHRIKAKLKGPDTCSAQISDPLGRLIENFV